MIAYFSDKTQDPMLASDHPAFKRIINAGKWLWTKHNHNGISGVLAHKAPNPPLDQMPNRVCGDGLIYFGFVTEPHQSDLARENIPGAFPVTLASGRVLDIPLAVESPRILAFDGSEESEHSSEFGSEAFRIWTKIESKDCPTKAELRRLIYLAINQCYAVTEELLTQLKWCSDTDLVPITLAIGGRDPKFAAAGGDTSRQSAAAG